MKYKIIKNDCYSKDYLDMFYNKIYPLKRNRIENYLKEDKKVSSITGEIILDELLKDNYKVDYEELNFIENESGKPYIKNKPIFYNISHSYQYVITAVSDYEIGVDIEKIRPTSIKTINQFATDKEKEYIVSRKEDIYKRLFEIYTLNEAYFKMKGTNLNNIKSIEFNITNYNDISCNDNSVSIKLIDDLDGYVIAICEKKN